jgi:ABC-type bacteriocin/lantibiotic exporter with double-glycine peptidase domain
MSSDKTLKQPWKAIRSFFVFWKDFLVGDSPVLALGVLIILGVAYLLRGYLILAPVIAIILVLVLMTYTVWQKTKKRSRRAVNAQNRQIDVLSKIDKIFTS